MNKSALKNQAQSNESLSEFCKRNCRLDANECADYAGVPRRTFYGWWDRKRKVVELIVLGIKADKERAQP